MGILHEALRLPRHARADPLPADKLAKVVEIEAALAAGLRPGTPGEVGDAMAALLSHYPGRPMSGTERVSMARDWIVDLSVLPADIIAAACQEWRQGAYRYAPKPGELLALAKPALEARQLYHRIAEDWLTAQRAHTP